MKNIKNKKKYIFVALGDGYCVVKCKGKLIKLKTKNENWD